MLLQETQGAENRIAVNYEKTKILMPFQKKSVHGGASTKGNQTQKAGNQ